MATGWLKGTVKAVPSGDSLLIMGSVRGGPPPEKTITLAALIAPKLARRDGRDEPFAWDSREFLRKKCIGKDVTFKVDYTVPSINREFGMVMLGSENVAFDVVSQGWAKVRQQGSQNNEVSSAYLTELTEREEKAQTQGYGIWTKTPGAAEASIRELPPSAIGDSANFDTMGLVENCKGQPLPAIVEAVRDGSTVRVYLLPEFHYVQVYCAGVQSPSMGRRVPPTESGAVPVAPKVGDGHTEPKEDEATIPPAESPVATQTAAQKLAAANVAAANAEVPPDPYAREAKHFTEVRVLNRDVRIVLEGADKFNNLIGSIHYPDKDAAIDLSLELVKQGLARVVEWSANMLEEEAKKRLKSAELQAKKDRLKIWTNYVPPATNSKAIRDVNFTGKVIEVVSGDCIVVADDAAPFSSPAAERRVNLSSIRAPKIGNPKKDERPAAYAREAKEYLRTLLIGQQVNVSMEYSRKMGLTDGPTPVPATPGVDRTMDFGSVFMLSVPKGEAFEMPPSLAVAGQPQGVNVAEIIVARGFATVVRHRDFEERSNYYEALLAAEAKALKAKRKIHSQKESPVAHINDLSLQGTTKKAKDFLPFLQRSRRLPAIVDYVLSGARFKLMIPKETCAIAFSLSGVRSLGRGEPYADESICFMRHRILQRDVEIEVETVDKTGTFLGSLWDAKGNVSVALLENGLAKLHPMFSPERTTEGHLLVQAQARAKKQLLKVWEGYVEGQDEAKSATSDSINSRDTSVIVVRVTDILGGGRFYIQSVEDARVGAIQQSLEGLRLKDMHMLPSTFQPAKGDTVIAQFTGDDSWNRALIVTAPRQVPTSGKAEYEVFYIDYGNQETVPHSRLRPLDPAVSSPLQGLAQLCSLAHVKVPELEEDFGEEAAQFISGVVSNKVFRMIVEEKDTTGGKVKGQGTGPRLIVTLIEQETNKSIQAILLEAGLARLEKKHDWDSPEKKEVFAKYEQLQDEARKARHNIWMYGDIESDEEDNSRFQRGSARR